MLNPKQIEQFETDGACLLKGAFTDYVAQVREAIAENMATPSWRERTYRPAVSYTHLTLPTKA